MRFDFNFDKVYRELQKERRGFFLPRTRHYYLERQDFFHIVVEKALKYIKSSDLEVVTEEQFVSIFWTTFRWQRLASHDKTKASQEYKNFVSRDEHEVAEQSDTPVDLDLKWMVEEIDKSFPTIQYINKGYSFTDASKHFGITGRGVSKRYHKEVENLKKRYE